MRTTDAKDKLLFIKENQEEHAVLQQHQTSKAPQQFYSLFPLAGR